MGENWMNGSFVNGLGTTANLEFKAITFDKDMDGDHNDPVNHPSHYTSYKGLEVIDLTEQMNFNRGNAVKYIARAGMKDPEKEIEDLEKAAWYIQREIRRVRALKEE